MSQLLLSGARFFWQKGETQLGKMNGWGLGPVGEHSGSCSRWWQMGPALRPSSCLIPIGVLNLALLCDLLIWEESWEVALSTSVP